MDQYDLDQELKMAAQNIAAAHRKAPDKMVLAICLLTATSVIVACAILFVFVNIWRGNLSADAAVPVSGPAMGELMVAHLRADENIRLAMMEEVVKVDVIYDNIFINGVDVSGLTKEQAAEKVSAVLSYVGHLEITIGWADGFRNDTHTLKFSEFDAGYDVVSAVNEAYAFGRDGGLFSRFLTVMGLGYDEHHITAKYTYNRDLVDDAVSRFNRLNQRPVEPTMYFEGGQFVITESSDGFTIHLDRLFADVLRLVDAKEKGAVAMQVTAIKPQNTSDAYRRANSVLGTSRTFFDASDTNRNENIRIAASRLHGQVILPGEVFSTNASFGPVNAAHGFRMSLGFSNGRVVPAMGGGICQVSSTLYVALLRAELEIVERHNHSMPISYLPMAFDATLVTGGQDLRFRNNTEHPITIITAYADNHVTVSIYGYEARPANRTVRLYSVAISSTPPPPTIYTVDPNLPPGARVVDVVARNRRVYQMIRAIDIDGVEVSREVVNTSTYRAFQGHVFVGPSAAPAPPPEQGHNYE
jgi:vancomycin resistance protein YoaR